jgi:hypothetical protein
MKKLLGIGVIFLFIGVAVAPSINSTGYQTIIVSDNRPPNDPQIVGPSKGRAGVSYLFIFRTTDPENQNVSYFIDWGDNTSDGWTNYYKSGQSICFSHTFYKIDWYAIRCKAKDTLGAESNWSHMSIPMLVKASNDNDLVKVTSQACGIQGFGNTTVKLTKQQYQNLGQYLVNFRARLNQTTTKEEAIPLFKEAVIELNKYGLLPKGMNIGEAQKLILKKNHFMNVLGSRFRNLNINMGCLVAGDALVEVYGLFLLLLNRMGIGALPLYLFNRVNPILIGSAFAFGSHTSVDHGDYYTPTMGWVNTLGLLGNRRWNGSLYGQISIVENPWPGPGVFSQEDFIGIIGFCGIKIGYGFFLGSALEVSLDSEP